jgi:hypothetical protein
MASFSDLQESSKTVKPMYKLQTSTKKINSLVTCLDGSKRDEYGQQQENPASNLLIPAYTTKGLICWCLMHQKL